MQPGSILQQAGETTSASQSEAREFLLFLLRHTTLSIVPPPSALCPVSLQRVQHH
jgi:hypothetical protein